MCELEKRKIPSTCTADWFPLISSSSGVGSNVRLYISFCHSLLVFTGWSRRVLATLMRSWSALSVKGSQRCPHEKLETISHLASLEGPWLDYKQIKDYNSSTKARSLTRWLSFWCNVLCCLRKCRWFWCCITSQEAWLSRCWLSAGDGIRPGCCYMNSPMHYENAKLRAKKGPPQTEYCHLHVCPTK